MFSLPDMINLTGRMFDQPKLDVSSVHTLRAALFEKNTRQRVAHEAHLCVDSRDTRVLVQLTDSYMPSGERVALCKTLVTHSS